MQNSIISASVLEVAESPHAVVIQITQPELKKDYFCITSSSSDAVLTLNRILFFFFPPLHTVHLSAPVISNSWGIQMQMSTEETFHRAEGAVPRIHFHTWPFIFCVESFWQAERQNGAPRFPQKKTISHVLQMKAFFKSHFSHII